LSCGTCNKTTVIVKAEAIQRQIAKLEVAKQVEKQGAKQGKLDDWFKRV
jgi:hypothetical protein